MTDADATAGRPVIAVRGARTHNLKDVDVDIERGRFTVVTGPSGSGKSSFAFDTVFAEGRRRFLETLSLSARQMAGQFPRPDVDRISGLPPAVAVGRALGRPTRLSTVSTLTGIDEQLRVLFARIGQAHCPSCEQPLSTRSVGEISDKLATLPERTKLVLLAPVVRDEAGDHAEQLEQIVRDGFVRVRVDGAMAEAVEVTPLDPEKRHSIEIVVDRLIVKPGFEQRLRESLDLTVEHGNGACIVTVIDGNRNEQDVYESTRFACAPCSLSYPDLDPRTLSFESPYGACASCRGTGRSDEGSVCTSCEGDRVNLFARAVRLGGMSLPELRRQPPASVKVWLSSLNDDGGLDPVECGVLSRVAHEIESRLSGMERLGLFYLTLDRGGRTLSGGELQRARLVNVVSAGLQRVLYVLDEPTSGLHPRDTAGLLSVIDDAVDSGATVLAVEHDPTVIDAAETVLTFGPGGGSDGGRLVDGRPRHASVGLSRSDDARLNAPEHVLSVRGARLRTLRDTDVDLPLGRLVGIAGVSGSGKTTFARDVLAAGVRLHLAESPLPKALADEIGGVELISGLSTLDQSPAGKSPRSCPATLIGVWSLIRQLLSRTKLARLRGYQPARFSFNNRDGQCSKCRGRGVEILRVRFLPPAVAQCSSCGGGRFEPETALVRFKQHSVADLLRLTIDEAVELFANVERIASKLRVARDAGLGYLQLGQSAATLSGGESQRLKLVQVLTRSSQQKQLFVLDEPTTGLAESDVLRLTALFRSLVTAGHSVVCVEHNLSLLAACDHVIEFGPGPGPDGGSVIAEGRLGDYPSSTPTGDAYQASRV